MSVVTNTPLSLSHFIADIATALAAYNRIRWYRGSSEHGAFEAITGAAATPALVATSRGEPFDVGGKSLTFRVNGGAPIVLVFAGVGELSASNVAAQLQGATALWTAAASGTKVSLTTVATGGTASIEILDGDAAPYLGLLLGTTSIGLDADTALSAGVHEYTYTDPQSALTYWYKVELRSSSTPVVAPLSPAFPVQRPARIADAQTIVCYLRLADMRGAAIPQRKVIVSNVFAPNTASGFGVFRHYEEIETNADGYAEIRLLRGMLIDLAIDGTSFVRRIQIPTMGDAVNLLDPALVTEDEFGIQEPRIDGAVRLS